jgi:hypothetical protein
VKRKLTRGRTFTGHEAALLLEWAALFQNGRPALSSQKGENIMAEDTPIQNAPKDPALLKAAKAAVGAAPVITGNEHCCIAQYWAVLETDGSLVRGHNVWRVARLGTGVYEVFFTNDVSAGVFVATVGRPGIFTEPPSEITLALRASGPGPEFNKGVWIQTFNSSGLPADRAFHLLVTTAG